VLIVVQGTRADEPKTSEIKVLRELRYREAGSEACKLDLALPDVAKFPGPRPAIVVIHGGGWIEGDKSSFTSDDRHQPGNIVDFARLGFVAATINYRLAREAPYPAALDDCRCAVRWLRAHATDYGIDTNRIGAWGNSAGGNLALLLALDSAAPALDKNEPYANESSVVQAAASDSGPIDLVAQHEQGTLRKVVEMFMSGPPDAGHAATYRRASPASYVAKKTAPLLLIYGETDEQVPIAVTDAFVHSLAKAGATDVSYLRLAAAGHCPHSMVRIAYLQPVVMDFFLRTLAPRPR
jgi:acetyl esterase/lipase